MAALLIYELLNTSGIYVREAKKSFLDSIRGVEYFSQLHI